MPNWCHNTLIAESEDHRLIERLVEELRPDDKTPGQLTFSAVVPEPEDNEDWYGWRVANWGTKWDASFGEPLVALGDSSANPAKSFQGGYENVGRFTWKFDTAWSPPLPFAKAASVKYPGVTFTLIWGELGSDSAGRIAFLDGAIIEDKELKVDEVLSESEMWF